MKDGIMAQTLRFPLRREELLAIFAMSLMGGATALSPNYALAAIGAVILIYLLSRGPLTRALVVIVGGITLLNVSAELSVEKYAYLAILVLGTLLSCRNLASHWPAAKSIGAIPILAATACVAVIVALSLLVARSSGITIQEWALDIPNYGMIVVACVIGLDLAIGGNTPREIAFPLLLAGVITALGYAIFWLQRRGLTGFDISRFILATQFLPGAAFCVSLAYAFDGHRTYRMGLLATLLVLTMLLSGTRISILFIVPIMVTMLAASAPGRLRVVSMVIAIGSFVALLAPILSSPVIADYINLDALRTRLSGVVPLVTSADPTSDPSVFARYVQTYYLEQAWSRKPFFGVGPGALYSYYDVVNSRPVDSPLAILSRFGVIGAGAFLVLFATVALSRLRRGAHWVPGTALVAFIALIAVWSLVSSPLDDKGVALGLIPLIGLCGVWRGDRRTTHRRQTGQVPVASESAVLHHA